MPNGVRDKSFLRRMMLISRLRKTASGNNHEQRTASKNFQLKANLHNNYHVALRGHRSTITVWPYASLAASVIALRSCSTNKHSPISIHQLQCRTWGGPRRNCIRTQPRFRKRHDDALVVHNSKISLPSIPTQRPLAHMSHSVFCWRCTGP